MEECQCAAVAVRFEIPIGLGNPLEKALREAPPRRKRRKHGLTVCFIGRNEDIWIFRSSRFCIGTQSITANDEVPNPELVECAS